jgi:hypothetical protein
MGEERTKKAGNPPLLALSCLETRHWQVGTCVATLKGVTGGYQVMTSKFKKMTKGAVLIGAMAFGMMLSTSTNASAQISVYTYNNNGYQQRTRVAYDRGYRDGLRAGERAARESRYSNGYYNNNNGYRNPYDNDRYNNGYGYNSYGEERGNYAMRQAYDQGYQRGYQEGVNRRSRSGIRIRLPF